MIDKYEVKILKVHEDFLESKLIECQKVGWEIAGQILVTNSHEGHEGYTFIHIPMKRKIVNND